MLWRVYASINPMWLSCSDCSLASLLGLAPKVAQADTRQVAKPLPQTKYQAKMPISSVPLSHPQHTWRFPVWLSVCTFLIEFKLLSMLPRYLSVREIMKHLVPIKHFVIVCMTWDLVDRSDFQGSLRHISAVAAHWWCHKPAPAPLDHGWHFHGWRDFEWAEHLTSRKGFHYCSRNS